MEETKLNKESSDDAETCIDDKQRLLKYSLFAPDLSYPSDIDSTFLEELGRPFKAVWFSYDYHDVGNKSSVEECAETLVVGVVNVTFSPDVVHRLELFLLTFKTSLEAIPLISKGTYHGILFTLEMHAHVSACTCASRIIMYVHVCLQ